MASTYLGDWNSYRNVLGGYFSDVGLQLTTTTGTTAYPKSGSAYLQQQQSQHWIDSLRYAMDVGLSNAPRLKMFDEPKEKTILDKLRTETKEFIGNRKFL